MDSDNDTRREQSSGIVNIAQILCVSRNVCKNKEIETMSVYILPGSK